MHRHPLVLIILVLAVCVAVGWGLPAGLDALKQALSPGGPPEQAERTDQPSQGKTAAEGTGIAPPLPDIPIN